MFHSLNSKLPRIVAKCSVADSCDISKVGLDWPHWVTGLVVEMSTNHTPSNYISPIILSVCRHISPKYDLVRELPGETFTHECRSVLAVHTKSLGAFQIAAAAEWIEHKSDKTSRRGVTFDNSSVRIAGDHGYKNVALSSGIVAKDSTGEE